MRIAVPLLKYPLLLAAAGFLLVCSGIGLGRRLSAPHGPGPAAAGATRTP